MNDCVSTPSIRAFLLIENRLLRESLVRLFRKRVEFLIVGQTSSADQIPADVEESKCDVLLGDSFVLNQLPAWTAENSEVAERLKVILIGMDAGEEHFLTAVRSGVGGYLLQDASASDVLAAVRSVFRGEAVCPPRLCATLFRFVAQAAREMPAFGATNTARPDLTLRQQQLVSLVAKGLTNKEIASRLNLSEFTVRNHIYRIFKQVDAESRSEAVEAARAHGYAISP
jgi:DNA-binding NarL/FixJ family response regulator